MKDSKYNVLVFAVYSICYEALILGGCGWAVFVEGHSGWWFLVALYFSGNQLKCESFGITKKTP